jgi:hypothetical protein
VRLDCSHVGTSDCKKRFIRFLQVHLNVLLMYLRYLLVIFNLDPSTSNEEVHQSFGAYGEVKEVRMLLLVFDSIVISFYLNIVMLIVLVSICR